MSKLDPRLKESIVSNSITWAIWVLIGVFGGYLLMRQAEDNNDEQGLSYFIFAICLFTLIGLINFLVKVLKIKKQIKKENEQHE